MTVHEEADRPIPGTASPLTSPVSRRAALQRLLGGIGLIGVGPLIVSGCTEPYRSPEPPPNGISIWRRVEVENTGNSPVDAVRASYAVDFHVGGQTENGYNWVDGYPILQATRIGYWTWGIATPSSFHRLDAQTPFGLDPDAFDHHDPQGQVGDYCATFVFKRSRLGPGERMTIDLIYLSAPDRLGLIHVYRRAARALESRPPADSLPLGDAPADAVPLADPEERVSAAVQSRQLGGPVRTVTTRRHDAIDQLPNPIYRDGMGIRYDVGFGGERHITSASVDAESVELRRWPHRGDDDPLYERVCGITHRDELTWRWCVHAPRLWPLVD